MKSPAPLNIDMLRNVTDGNTDLETQLFSLYRKTAKTCFTEMEAGLSHKKHDKWHDYVHQLKGASANIGAEEMKQLCTEAEFLKEDEADKKQSCYTSIQEAFKRLDESMKDIETASYNHFN